MLIVGEGEAGKTSLARKIENQRYQLQPGQPSTEGIDILQWYFPYKDQAFQVNIWDFGGQEIYHATHQFFLTKRSLYALVVDNRKEHTNLYYWLNVVELLSDNSPLLIIQNEKDDRSVSINIRELRGQFENLKETLPTNLQTNRGLDDILNELKHYLGSLPHIGDQLPKPWLASAICTQFCFLPNCFLQLNQRFLAILSGFSLISSRNPGSLQRFYPILLFAELFSSTQSAVFSNSQWLQPDHCLTVSTDARLCPGFARPAKAQCPARH